MTPRKEKLRAAFDAGAPTYDVNAIIQRTAANRLADRIAALNLPPRPRVLEIGCGTGFLTQALRARIGAADWTVTDLSPAMLDACRRALGDPADVRFLVMDGERPAFAPEERFDLICASLAFQWFEDLPGAISRLIALLAPGGRLAFATLGQDSLVEWRRAHDGLGLAPSTPAFPSIGRLRALTTAGTVEEERLVQAHPNATAFLAGLKAIGAGEAAAGRRPLAPGALRAVMAAFEAGGAAATYHIAYGLFARPDARRGVFVTGTGTGVGKTVVAAVLARAWDADYWKPVQTGLAEEAGDTAEVARLAGLEPGRLHPPRHAFAAPLSPDAAAAREGANIALDDFTLPASDRPIVVEGAGGPLAPLNAETLTVDLMARLALPVVVVVANQLGAINHALLTLEAVRARGLEVLGVVLAGPAFADNRAAIETHGAVRVLAELPWAETVTPELIGAWAALIPHWRNSPEPLA